VVRGHGELRKPPTLALLCVTQSAEGQRMRDPSEELSVRLGSQPDGPSG
jgi:hypothetical protein